MTKGRIGCARCADRALLYAIDAVRDSAQDLWPGVRKSLTPRRMAMEWLLCIHFMPLPPKYMGCR